MKAIFSKLFGLASGLAKSATALSGKLLGLAVAHPVITVILGVLIVGGIIGGIYFANSGNEPSLPFSASTSIDPETPSEDPNQDPEIDWTEVKQLTILIEDDRVFVNDIEFEDAERLRLFLEEIYDDGKIVRLDDVRSILATRDWVVSVLDDLDISYAQLIA